MNMNIWEEISVIKIICKHEIILQIMIDGYKNVIKI